MPWPWSAGSACADPPAGGRDTASRTTTTSYGDTRTAPDADPRITRVTDPSGTITTTIDLLGRETSYTDATGLVTTTSYDIVGRVTSTTRTPVSGGASTLGWTYLDDGRVSTVTLDGVQVAAVSYDSAAQLSGVAYGPADAPVSSLGSLTRSPAGAVTAQTWTVGSRTLGETLTRSQAGRVTRSVATDSAGPAGTVNWSYGYDTVGRLTTAVLAAAGTRPTVTLGYGYAGSGGCGADPAAGLNGSRTSMSRQLGTATPASSTICTDHASRVTSVASTTGGLTITPASFTYDTHGNLTQFGTQAWTYDGADRVASTTANGITPSLSVYVRDTLGRVVSSGPAGSPTRYGFTSTDDSPDLQLTSTGAIVERYVTLPGGVLYTKGYAAPSLTSWAVTNLHGDTVATITGTTVTAGFVYDPFGQPLGTTTGAVDLAATSTTRTGTTTDAWHGSAQRGYEHTGGLNQILMGARTYLPELGIFTATDPIEGGNTTTYTYPQDPINGSDLTGMCWGWGCESLGRLLGDRDNIRAAVSFAVTTAAVVAAVGVCVGSVGAGCVIIVGAIFGAGSNMIAQGALSSHWGETVSVRQAARWTLEGAINGATGGYAKGLRPKPWAKKTVWKITPAKAKVVIRHVRPFRKHFFDD